MKYAYDYADCLKAFAKWAQCQHSESFIICLFTKYYQGDQIKEKERHIARIRKTINAYKENLKKNDHLDDLVEDRTGLIWFKIGTSGGILQTRHQSFWCYKKWVIYWSARRQLIWKTTPLQVVS